MRIFKFSMIVVFAWLHFSASARAAIIPVAYYHLGEADPGAVAGNGVNSVTIDSVGGNNLTITGSATYTSSLSSVAAANTGSMLGVDFGVNTSTFYSRTGAVTTGNSNFGMEGWFKTNDPTAVQNFVLNGVGNGYAIVDNLAQHQICFLSQNVGFFSTGFTPTAGVWFYAAIVDEGGELYGFINNTTPIDLGAHSVTTPTGQFRLGGQSGAGYVQGAIDEVRVFTFNPGAFSPNDLLIAPEPSSLALLGVAALGLLVRRRVRRCSSN